MSQVSQASATHGAGGFRVLGPLLPGLYAWVSTVLFPAARAGWAPRVTALFALGLLLVGLAVTLKHERIGRVIGVWAFLAACIATWLLASDQLAAERLDIIRTGSGAIGWGLFAFGWGSVRGRAVPEEDPRAIEGPPLDSRGRLPSGAIAVMAVGVLGALAAVLTAWRVRREDHALLAHAVAFVAAVALVSAAATIAIERGKGSPAKPSRSLAAASPPLMLVALLLSLGMIWLILK